MLKKTILLLLITTQTLWSQVSITEHSHIKLPADFYVGQDAFKDLYYLQNNNLYKQTKEQTYNFAQLNLGTVHLVDISNPLRLLIYYKNANQLVLLDNQLNPIAQINLNQLENPIMAKHVGLASLNKIWIVDPQTNQVSLLDRDTQQVKTLTPSIQPTPLVFKSTLNQLFWLDEQNQLYQTDLFGKIQLINTLEPHITLHFTDNQLCIYQKNERLYLKKHHQFEAILLSESVKSEAQIYYINHFLSIFTQGHLQIKHITF